MIQTIQEAHPLKQGLKLMIVTLIAFAAIDSRSASIKTRIETPKYQDKY